MLHLHSVCHVCPSNELFNMLGDFVTEQTVLQTDFATPTPNVAYASLPTQTHASFLHLLLLGPGLRGREPSLKSGTVCFYFYFYF